QHQICRHRSGGTSGFVARFSKVPQVPAKGAWPCATETLFLAARVKEAFSCPASNAAEYECASVRIDAHPWTMLQVRASPVRRPKSRAGCVSTDREDARRCGRVPRQPSAHRRPVSTNQPVTTLR